jgi:hypothetical protein
MYVQMLTCVKSTENLQKISPENPGKNTNGAKIRQTGSWKDQSSSLALKERSHRTVTTMSSSSLKEEDGGTVQGHFPPYG